MLSKGTSNFEKTAKFFCGVLYFFLTVWVFVGAWYIFDDSECRDSKKYLDGYPLWAISTGICAFWIAVFGCFIILICIWVWKKKLGLSCFD